MSTAKNEYGGPILFWACRFIVGMVCLASALGKSMDFQGFVEVLSTYQFFPDWGLWLVAIGISSLEWVLALWLLSSWRIGSSALVALSLYGLSASGLAITLLRGLDLPNCGCYGVFFTQPLR